MTSSLMPIADGIWHVESTVGIFPARMTVLQTSEGLVLWSPVDIDDTLAEKIAALGEVHAIVSPNLFHHLFVNKAKHRFPNAQVLSTEGLKKRKTEVKQDALLSPNMLGSDLAILPMQGCGRIEEVVVLHKASKTLVVTDLVFNVRRAETLRAWFVFKVFAGTLGDVGQSRLWRYLTTDAELAGQSLEEILALPFDRLVMAHGEVVDRGGKDALAKGTARLRRHARLPALAP